MHAGERRIRGHSRARGDEVLLLSSIEARGGARKAWYSHETTGRTWREIHKSEVEGVLSPRGWKNVAVDINRCACERTIYRWDFNRFDPRLSATIRTAAILFSFRFRISVLDRRLAFSYGKIITMASQEDNANPGVCDSNKDPCISVNLVENASPSLSIPVKHTKVDVPTLAFGLYKIPNGDEGVQIISDAILRAGYRHLDSGSIYGNEKTLGRALADCCGTTTRTTDCTSQNEILERSELFVASKVWNDAQKQGRLAVRRSVEQSLVDTGLKYLDICYVHWPVPGHFVDTYRELLLLQQEGKINFLGISNFRIADYEKLLADIPQEKFVPPLIHQFEVSPFMYRPETIEYFREKYILVAASKALNRTVGLNSDDGAVVRDMAKSHSVSPTQVLLRWSFQKGLIVLSKTTSLSRMRENRALFHFILSPEEMDRLDDITKEENVKARDELESKRRTN